MKTKVARKKIKTQTIEDLTVDHYLASLMLLAERDEKEMRQLADEMLEATKGKRFVLLNASEL